MVSFFFLSFFWLRSDSDHSGRLSTHSVKCAHNTDMGKQSIIDWIYEKLIAASANSNRHCPGPTRHRDEKKAPNQQPMKQKSITTPKILSNYYLRETNHLCVRVWPTEQRITLSDGMRQCVIDGHKILWSVERSRYMKQLNGYSGRLNDEGKSNGPTDRMDNKVIVKIVFFFHSKIWNNESLQSCSENMFGWPAREKERGGRESGEREEGEAERWDCAKMEWEIHIGNV